MNICTVLASGAGTRMCRDENSLPKQFMTIGDKPLLCYTLDTVIACEEFDRICLGLSAEFMGYGAELVEKYYCYNQITIVKGGDSRMRTFFNIFECLKEEISFAEDDYICLTDANRPLISKELYKECVLGAMKYGICCPAKPVVDGVCVVKNKTIQEIAEKSSLYSFQTPECFRATDFIEICPSYDSVGKCLGVTEIFVKSGMAPHVIPSDDRSFKITTPIDLEIMKAYMEI